MTKDIEANHRAKIDPSAPVGVNVDELEERAKQSLERLLKAVEALDKKRHQLTHPLKYLPAGVVPAAGAAVIAIAAGTIAAFAIAKRRKPLSRLSTLLRRREEPSFGGQLLRHAGLTVLTFALAEVGKLAVKKLLPSGAEIEGSKQPRRTR